MKKRIPYLLIILTLACLLPASRSESAGTLVRIESLSSGNFNPSSGEKSVMSFTVLTDTTTNVIIRVFSPDKAMVYEKKIDGLKGGRYKFTWDGKDGKGKMAEPGFYKYELLAATANKQKSDNDNSLVEVRKTKAEKADLVGNEIPPALYDISGAQPGNSFRSDVSGYFRSSTGGDTSGVNWNREEIYLNLKGGYGPAWVYDLSFLPSYTKDQAFAWDNFVSSALVGYRMPWAAFDLGYRNYLEGYYDPLRLLSDYMMGSQRISFTSKLNLLENLYVGAGVHRMVDLNQTGLEARATYDIWKGIKAGGSFVTNFYPLYRNVVIAGDARVELGAFTPADGTILAVEFARSNGATKLDDTHPESTFGGNAVRFEAEHRMFYLVPSAGDLTIKFAAQSIGGAFVADYGDIPNGCDNVGTEIGLDYFINPGFPVLRSFRNELKGTFLTNTGATISTNKLREYLSLGFTDALSLICQYEQTMVNDKTVASSAPISKNQSTYGELRYYKPGGRFETSLRATYTTDTFVALASPSEYVSARLLVRAYVTPNIRPYLAYERVNRFYGAGLASNQDYHHITPGIEWTFFPATNTEIAIQGGYVINNLNANVTTYYFRLGHNFLEKLSALLTIGSQTSIDAIFRAYLEIKWEF